MDISDYYRKLQDESQKISEQTIDETSNLGKLHHYASILHEISDYFTMMMK